MIKQFLLLTLALLLASCARVDPRHGPACAAYIPAFTGVGHEVLPAPPERLGLLEIRVDYQTRPAPDAPWQVGFVRCRFHPGGDLETLRLAEFEQSERGLLDETARYWLERWGALAADEFDVDPAASVSAPLDGTAYLAQILLNGLVLGAIYALIAVGYGIIFSLLETINFAFGDLTMVATILAVIPFAAAASLGFGPALLMVPLVLILVPALSALIGTISERLVYRPLTSGNRQAPLVAAIGLSLVLQNGILLSQGPRAKWLKPVLTGGFDIALPGGSIRIAHLQAFVILSAAAAALLLWRLLVGTRLGRNLRAVAADRHSAALCGVDPTRVMAQAFALSGALAGLGGVIFMLYYGQTDHAVGLWIGFKALTGAIIGGLGTPLGAMAGGLLVGLFESLFAGYISAAWRDVAVFTLLVGLLMVRPTGLFGDKTDTNH